MSKESNDLELFKAFLEKLQCFNADIDPTGDVNEVIPWMEPSVIFLETLAEKLKYSATVAGSVAATERRQVLRLAFQSSRYPVPIPSEARTFWGVASSAQRLYAISRFLVWMCDHPYAKKVVARRQCAQDLCWLKLQFFNDAMRFEWPQVILAPVVRRQGVNAAFTKPLTPSAVLAVIVGKDPLPRTEVVSTLWAYIKKNGLQSVQNKRMIHADENLKKIFEKNEVSMFEIADLIGRHLR
jgi:upstream activation factor subunit UAF30